MAIIGAILGDIVGSHYEFARQRPADFDYKTAPFFTSRNNFTDDTVLSIATKAAIRSNPNNPDFAGYYKKFGNKYYNAGYGGMFQNWLNSDDPMPYSSYGNGSAMRVSYIADYYKSYADVVKYAELSAKCTHNHPEGIKGATVTAACIWMAKNGSSKNEILRYAGSYYRKLDYRYSPYYTLKEIRNNYRWNSTCQDSVPAAIRCVYEANSYSEFIRNVYSLNCDTDTLCAIGGGIAEELFADHVEDELMCNATSTLCNYLDDYLCNIVLSAEFV